jgi:hypothetical protein
MILVTGSIKFTQCLINTIVLNLIIIFQRLINKKKIVIFYHPNQKLLNIHTYYIEKLFEKKNKEFYVIYLHQNYNFKRKKYYFVINYFCNYIYNCNFFISNNVCDSFTPNSKKIYIHHDIFDTPLVTSKKEIILRNRLSKYNHILLASSLSKKIFIDLFDSTKKPKIEIIGYFKLDLLLKKKIKEKKKTSIVIAPTDYKSFPQLSLYRDAKFIINHILKKTDLNVIFRPHPSNLGTNKLINLLKHFKENKRVSLDNSGDYQNTYNSSNLMITDISGTAYTFAFLTKRPVIFYCSYNKKFENKFQNLSYFKKRNIVGIIARGKKDLIKLNVVLNDQKKYKNDINQLLKKIIKVGETKNNFFKFLNRY